MTKFKEIQDLVVGGGGSAGLYIMNFLEFDLKPVLVTVTLQRNIFSIYFN